MFTFKSYCQYRENLADRDETASMQQRFMTEMMRRIIAEHPEETFEFIQKIALNDQDLSAAISEFNKASQNSLRSEPVPDVGRPVPPIS